MKNVNANGCAAYEAPHIELYEIDVEQGYSISGAYNEKIGGRVDEQSW